MTDQEHDSGESPHILSAHQLRGLSLRDFAQLGVAHIAYIKPVLLNGAQAFAIHAADGTPIGAAPSAQLADAAIRQHEMEPFAVH
jgi:hypothetical protein